VRDTTVAARYARALFLVTEKRSETARALEDLIGLGSLLEPKARLARFLANPETRLADKREMIDRAFRGRVLPTVAVFVDLLLRKKRLGEFAMIVEQFEALVEKALGVTRAHVVSAVPLDEQESKRLHQVLEGYTKAHVKLTREVDPELLGGALVRIGDRVIDRSVKTLLETIEERLYEVSV
jgi:F-type H+-transporting ATPase subunit delta